MKRTLAISAALMVCWASSAGAVSLIPHGDNPGSQSPEASAEQWLQWIFDFEVADGGDPINDPTGELQNLHQTFPVHMVGGTFGGGAERKFKAQAGKPLLVPLQNQLCIGNSESPCDNANQEGARAGLDDADQLFLKVNGTVFLDANSQAEVDGVDSDFRIETDLFSLAVDADSSLAELAGLPPGDYDSSFNYGFYAFLDLEIGTHIVEFGGRTGEFSNSVTAEIEVVPLPAGLPLLAAGLAVLGIAARRRPTAV